MREKKKAAVCVWVCACVHAKTCACAWSHGYIWWQLWIIIWKVQQITQQCPTFKDVLDTGALGAKRTNDWEGEESERRRRRRRGGEAWKMKQRAGVEVAWDRAEESYGEWKKGKGMARKRSGELAKASVCFKLELRTTLLAWRCVQAPQFNIWLDLQCFFISIFFIHIDSLIA